MKGLRQQKGMSVLKLLGLMVLVGFFLLLGVRLVPIYMDNMSVKSSLSSLEQVARGNNYNDDKLMELLSKRFAINNVSSVSVADAEIFSEGSRTVVALDYEVRMNLVGNIDLVVSFQEKAEF